MKRCIRSLTDIAYSDDVLSDSSHIGDLENRNIYEDDQMYPMTNTFIENCALNPE